MSIHEAFKSTISTAFYHNHVKKIETREAAYNLAKVAPETIITSLSVKRPVDLGLPVDAKVLVANDGAVVGRTAKARVIVEGNQNLKELKILQECIANNHHRPFLKSSLRVGLDSRFETKAEIMISENYVNNLYNTLINFEIDTDTVGESDVFLYVDPDWSHVDYPDGLVVLDPVSNVGAVLGLRYFGEIKKGILSLVWNLAKKQGFIPCHGGLKYVRYGDKESTIAVFGLSGSGKSTITFAEPEDADEVLVLHDDAFVINRDSLETIALEPSYFDKTSDYPMGHEAVESFVSVQNNGVKIDEHGKLVLQTEDIRNGNGRTIKSSFFQDNRVDFMEHPVTSVFWIMRDDAFPPCVKITDPNLAAIMGATITTTRSSAENTDEIGKLVIEPYANPFMLYPLIDDYNEFKRLFEEKGVECYVLNTGFFNNLKVTPQVTLGALESISKKKGEFDGFGALSGMEVLRQDGYTPNFGDKIYLEKLKKTFTFRSEFLNNDNPRMQLPEDVKRVVSHKLDEISSYIK